MHARAVGHGVEVRKESTSLAEGMIDTGEK